MDLDFGMEILSGKLLESNFICIKPQVAMDGKILWFKCYMYVVI
jgi:hypothetical protein